MTALLVLWFSPAILLVLAPLVCRAYDALRATIALVKGSRPPVVVAPVYVALARLYWDALIIGARFELAMLTLERRYAWFSDPNYQIRLRFMLLTMGSS